MSDPTPLEQSSHPPMRPEWPLGLVQGDGQSAWPYGPRGYTVLAWIVIGLACAFAIGRHLIPEEKDPSAATSKDRIGIIMMDLQGKYAVGAAETTGNNAMLYAAMNEALNRGSVDQRQRFVVLAGELMGRDEAGRVLAELNELIASQQPGPDEPTILSPEQAEVQRVLGVLYPPPTEQDSQDNQVPAGGESVSAAAPMESVDPDTLVNQLLPVSLSPDDAAILTRELGWFGKLAQHPVTTGSAATRDEVISSATLLMYFIVAIAVMFVVIAVFGFAGLVAVIVLASLRKLGPGLGRISAHHGLYAETFAVWMALFLLMQLGAALAANAMPQLALVWVALAFLSSLLALMWPVARGVPWRAVRQDIGWHLGSNPVVQILLGWAGYSMTLPILGVGLGMTIGLMKLQEWISPPGEGLESAAGPSHPIIEQLASGDWFTRIMVLFLGAVCAPIVEETMFRGALYRHLREASTNVGFIMSILLSTLINSFIFAAIHPQGWVAIPALMSLAVGFSLAREWRGSIIPAMIMHGTSNFLVLSIVLIALSL